MNLTHTLIILLITSLQLIGTSTAIIVDYTSNNKDKDARYTWAVSALVASVVSLLIGLLAYFHWYIPYVFQGWVLLLTVLNIITTVIGIAVFKSSDSLPITGWIVAVIACLILNGFAGSELLPLSSPSPSA